MNLTKAQAVSAYKAVCKKVGEEPVEGVFVQGGGNWPAGKPLLVKDFELWGSPTAWSVVWEEGPCDWAQGVVGGFDEGSYLLAEFLGTEPKPQKPLVKKGVYFEPVNGWVLGLYSDN